MWTLVKTYYGYPRVIDNRWVGRVEVGYLYACRVCGGHFKTTKGHSHEKEKQVPPQGGTAG